MTDRELLAALTEFARRVGLLDEARRFTIEDEPVTEEKALCLAFGMHGQTRLCCTYGKDHAGSCSWERAMVGKSACANNQGPSANAPMCERPTHHAGEHKATGPDGVRWTWGDRAETGLAYAANKAREAAVTGELGTVCEAPSPVQPGPDCVYRAGHDGSHSNDPTNPRT